MGTQSQVKCYFKSLHLYKVNYEEGDPKKWKNSASLREIYWVYTRMAEIPI